MDGNQLPPVPGLTAPSETGGGPSSVGSGSVVPLPSLIPTQDPHRAPDDPSAPPRRPPPLMPPSPEPLFLTALEEDEEDAEDVEDADDREKGEGVRLPPMVAPRAPSTGRYHPPPSLARVGSFIRSVKFCLHQRGCSKCRLENHEHAALVTLKREESAGKPPSFNIGRSGGGGSRPRSRRGRKRSGGSRSGASRQGTASHRTSGDRGKSGTREKCSALCVHLKDGAETRGRSATRAARQGSASSRHASASSRARRKQGDGGASMSADSKGTRQFTRPGSEHQMEGSEWAPTDPYAALLSNTRPDIKTLSIYHKKDFEELTWEELMALLMTNFQASKELTKAQKEQLQELKEEVLQAISVGLIKRKDPRLKWKNRQTILMHQVKCLSRARDIYAAVRDSIAEHNAGLRRLIVLFEVRAYKQVHDMRFDYIKSGNTLLRFTQIPGCLCRGINLYQACIAVVLGRRWFLRVMERRLKRINSQTTQVNAEIETVLHYKFQELPAHQMKVAHLLRRLQELTIWFEDVRLEMCSTVETLHAELQAGRETQIEAAIVTTMDAAVERDSDWPQLYDRNRCLAGLCDDLAARNAALRRLLAETRSGERSRADAEWRDWLLRFAGGHTRPDGDGGHLRIRRKTWLPV